MTQPQGVDAALPSCHKRGKILAYPGTQEPCLLPYVPGLWYAAHNRRGEEHVSVLSRTNPGCALAV